MTDKTNPPSVEQYRALIDLVKALQHFSILHATDLSEEAVAALEGTVESGATFLTQIEHSANNATEVIVSLKIPDATREGGFHVIPMIRRRDVIAEHLLSPSMQCCRAFTRSISARSQRRTTTND